jgi:hypothetical protein
MSIAISMTRDFARRSAWPALFTLIYLVVLPWLAYGLLRWRMPLPLEYFSEAPLPFSFLVVASFACLVVIWVAQGENRFGVGPRLYVLPMQTWWIVACRMLQSGLATAALYGITVASYNLIFGTFWPVALPAAALVVLVWWVQAYTWTLLHFRLWRFVAVLAMVGSFGYWISTRTWTQATPADFVVLCGYAAAEFMVSVQGVARHRRGDCEAVTAWLARMQQWLDSRLTRSPPPLASPHHALSWSEWRHGGFALPVIVAGVLVFVPLMGMARVALGWTLAIGTPLFTALDVLHVELVLALVFQPQIALLCGLVLGHRNQCRGRLEFDSYSATRPVSDRVMSAVLLRTAWRSVLAAYAVSALVCLATAAWVYWQAGAGELHSLARLLPKPLLDLGVWSVLVVCGASLLASWTMLGLSASAILCGRPSFVCWLLGAGAAVVIVWLNVIHFLAPPEMANFLSAAGCAVFGLACLVGTAVAFALARRRDLILSRTCVLSEMGWLMLCVGWGALWAITAEPPTVDSPALLRWLALPLLPGLLALVFAPLATVPLALAWNRHR